MTCVCFSGTEYTVSAYILQAMKGMFYCRYFGPLLLSSKTLLGIGFVQHSFSIGPDIILTYLICMRTEITNMVPCCNEEKVRFKTNLVVERSDLICDSVSQGKVSCLPVPDLAYPSCVHICPVYSYDGQIISKWKWFWSEGRNRSRKRDVTIVVDLHWRGGGGIHKRRSNYS